MSTASEVAEALEKRIASDAAFERDIVNNGGAISDRAKRRMELDRTAASLLRSQAAQIEAKDKALEPFAMMAQAVDDLPDDSGAPCSSGGPPPTVQITVGDLRAARTAKDGQ